MFQEIRIGSKIISHNSPTYIIAEIGVNHGGDMVLAEKMIVEAKNSGADAVKFQTFTAETLVTPGTPKVRYQESTTSPTEDHYQMIRSLEFQREDHLRIINFCKKVGVEFISTPYDVASAKFLEELGVNAYKTASADIVDLPLQEFIAKTGKPSIVASGMASLGEVEEAVNIYRAAKNSNLILLHCVSNYPCSDGSLNLRAMQTLASAFNTVVGYSDHSVDERAATLSVVMGARVIEKHFTLDKNLPGPDHKASSTPEELKYLVQQVRRTELMLGKPEKVCQEEERQMSQVSRKSIVSRKEIKSGSKISLEDLIMKRPGTGLPARNLKSVIGKVARRDIAKDTLLQWNDIE